MKAPSLDGLRRFLRERAVLADGRVLSWVSERGPGYPYPEIGGYWLTCHHASGSRPDALAHRVADWLTTTVSPAGAVGRDGIDYLFDAGIVLAGLDAFERAGGRLRDETATERLRAHVAASIRDRRAVGGTGTTERRWSTSIGCHHLKLIHVVASSPVAPVAELTRALSDVARPLYDDGRFRTNDWSRDTYLHSMGYAAEGLAGLSEAGDEEAARRLVACADWFAAVQADDGGLQAWHDGTRAHGPLRTDASAQAVRIWVRADPDRFRTSIARALEFLARMQADSGGIVYEPGSPDVNTWCTMFALQAVEWSRAGRAVSPIV